MSLLVASLAGAVSFHLAIQLCTSFFRAAISCALAAAVAAGAGGGGGAEARHLEIHAWASLLFFFRSAAVVAVILSTVASDVAAAALAAGAAAAADVLRHLAIHSCADFWLSATSDSIVIFPTCLAPVLVLSAFVLLLICTACPPELQQTMNSAWPAAQQLSRRNSRARTSELPWACCTSGEARMRAFSSSDTAGGGSTHSGRGGRPTCRRSRSASARSLQPRPHAAVDCRSCLRSTQTTGTAHKPPEHLGRACLSTCRCSSTRKAARPGQRKQGVRRGAHP